MLPPLPFLLLSSLALFPWTLSAQQLPESLLEGSGEEGSGEEEPEELSLSKPSCSPRLDLLLLFDSSGSMKDIYQKQVNGALHIIRGLSVRPDNVRIGAIQFAGYPHPEFALNTYTVFRDIEEHLQNMGFRSGVTRTGKALRKAQMELKRLDRGSRKGAGKAIIMFTDGVSLDDPQPVALQLHADGVAIYVMGIVKDPFLPELYKIAGSEDRVFKDGQIQNLKEKLLKDLEQNGNCVQKESKHTETEEKLALPENQASSPKPDTIFERKNL